MKFITLYITGLLVTGSVSGQTTVDSVLAVIESNNTTLAALRKKTEAEKTGNKTGLLPPNPEAGFNYLWGNPSTISNRRDFSIQQSFDFPTTYAYSHQIMKLKNEQADTEYEHNRQEILSEARLLCSALIYHNALVAEHSKRLNHARQIADLYRKKFDAGETSILESNKAQVHMLNQLKEFENRVIERNVLLAGLVRLNGGTTLEFTDSVFIQQPVIADFEQWFAMNIQHNPGLDWIKQESVITQRQQQLQTAMGLPGFSAGYMSETVTGEQFQGVTLGVTLPLWGNRNTVKYAKARVAAVEAQQADMELQFYQQIKALHAQVVDLQISVTSYRHTLAQYCNTEFLAKALSKGEISLGEYIIELSFYYESADKLLSMEQSLHSAWTNLMRYQ